MAKLKVLVIGSGHRSANEIRELQERLSDKIEIVGAMTIKNFVDGLEAMAKLPILKYEQPKKKPGQSRQSDSGMTRRFSALTAIGRAKPQIQARRGRR